MNVMTKIGELRERALAYWLARTAQEQKFLAVGGAVVVLALLYLALLDPALSGRDALRSSLPELRQEAARVEALAVEARGLAGQQAPAPAPLSREALAASMKARGLDPASLSLSGEYAKIELTGVSFANLVAWLDSQRQENRLLVQDAQFTAQEAPGQVNATLTLRQNSGPAS